MATSNIFPTPLPTRKGVTFYDPANTGNTYTSKLNPIQIKRKPESVRKYTRTTNGTSVITGSREYPPSEIKLVWNQMDKTDYEGIRPFTGINPIVFVDNNDNGYLGVLVIDSVEQLANKSGWVYAVEASFLVVAPYNGSSSTINTLAVPTLSVAYGTPGYIPANTTMYAWATVITPWGESTPGSALTIAPGATANQYASISWTAPTSNYYRKTRLYWNNANSVSSATFLGEVLSGLTQGFTIYGPYVAYSTLNPPLFGRNFTGYFAGGLWTNDT